MAGNPLVEQGTLNRLRGSVIWPGFPALNVTAPFLGKEGIGLALEGEATGMLPTMTGVVTSPEVYMMIGLTINLLKTQNISNLYKLKMETDALLRNGTVRPDARELSPYEILNCSIQSVRELNFSGNDAGYGITVKGYYVINNNLWNLS